MISKYQQLRAQALPHNRATLMALLKKHDIQSLTVFYSGSGSTGDTDKITTTPPEAVARLADVTVSLHQPKVEVLSGVAAHALIAEKKSALEALREFTLAWVEQTHCCWANRDGGSGDVTFNVAQDTCRLKHTEYYTGSLHHEYSL